MNTKTAQVAAAELGIPINLITFHNTNSVNGANSFTTVSSIGTDSIANAVRKACKTLNSRLQPIKISLGKNASWQNIVKTAWPMI